MQKVISKNEPSIYRYIAKLLVIFLSLGASSVVFADGSAPQDASVLRSFEKSAQPAPEAVKEEPHREPSHSHEHENDIGDELAEEVIKVAMNVIVEGGISTMQRIAPETDAALRRNNGEPLIPYARYDFAYQRVPANIASQTHRFEGGYGPFALLLENCTFKESQTGNTLRFDRQMFLYRMSAGAIAEVDIGLGQFTMSGTQSTSIGMESLPVRFRLGENISLEFRPSWAGSITDYETALYWGNKFGSIKVGYRNLSSPGVSLNGPFAGIALYY